jgi:nucleoside-diphosphate-sugar epimerase
MKTIGIIGGNGQVGSEASLFLSQIADIQVIPISRSVYGSTLLRHCGLECRHGSLNSAIEARRLLEGCDLVADFSAPQGSPQDVPKIIAANIVSAIENSPDAKQYVYISSHSVFRHTAKQPRYRYYARAKLFGEQVAQKTGRAAKKEVYVLRLGMVHGLLQTISHLYMSDLRAEEEAVLPNVPSLAVFCFSVAEALVNIANHKEMPGTYTLVSVPAWKQEEIHAYYCALAGLESRARTEVVQPPTFGQSLRRIARETADPVWREILGERELIDDLLLKYAPDLARRLRSKYYVSQAASEFAMRDGLAWRPILQDFDAPGERMHSLSDSRVTMHEPTRAVAELLDTSLQRRLAEVERVIARQSKDQGRSVEQRMSAR